MNHRNFTAYLTIVALLLGPCAAAQETAPDPVKLSRDDLRSKAKKSVYFPEIQKASHALNEKIIDQIMAVRAVPTGELYEITLPTAQFEEFGDLVARRLNAKLDLADIENLDHQLRYFRDLMEVYPENRLLWPVLSSIPEANGDWITFEFTSSPVDGIRLNYLSMPNVSLGGGVGNKPQDEVLNSLADAIEPYRKAYTHIRVQKTRDDLERVIKDWDRYFSDGRSQFIWEIGATTLFHQKHFKKGGIVGPPSSQVILFHPNIVVENLDAAPDGDQLKGAVAIEWIGMNWWDDSWLGIPFGVSFTSLYSDRAGVDDVGHGVSLYFDNKYSIGWASHGGDDGFYVTIDTLRLIDDKKKRVEKYREKINGYLD